MFSRLSTMLGSLRPEASNAILHCVDVILQCCYQANCFRAIEDVLVATKVMGKLVDTVKEAKELGLVLVGYLTILGRMTVCDVGTLIRWGDLSALIDVWCEKVRGDAEFVSFRVGRPPNNRSFPYLSSTIWDMANNASSLLCPY